MLNADGKQEADAALSRVQRFIDRRDLEERFESGTPVYKVAGARFDMLLEADLYTLEEVAGKPRAEVAAVPGVGPVTLSRLEAAMAKSNLSWAEAA